MAKFHGPSAKRASLLYGAGVAVWFWSGTKTGQMGKPPYAAIAMMVVAMVAGPVALMNFIRIVWGSFRTERSVPAFLLELTYSAILPGLFFAWHIMSWIR